MHNIVADRDMLARRGKYANKLLDGQGASVRPGFDPASMLFNDLQVGFFSEYTLVQVY
jgi:U3 small nucleolar RNA-associated protein 22